MNTTEMKRLVILGVWLALLSVVAINGGCRSRLTMDQWQTLQRAEKQFKEAQTPGDYTRSAQEFQKAIDSGLENGSVFCYQGNAYALGGDKARALAAYRQAFPYMMNNAYLQADMKTVGAKEGKKPLLENLLFWQNWVSYPGKQAIVLVLTAMSLIIALIPWFWPKKVWKAASVLLVLATSVALFSFLYDYYRFDALKYGIVLEQTTARKGDSATYAAAFNQPLTVGMEFQVLQQRGDWVLARLDDNLEGWIESKKAKIW